MVHCLETLSRLNREQYERQIEPPPAKRRLVIAIDYDDTYTADPVLWAAVVAVLASSHEVICVTARRCTAENRNELRRNLPPQIETIILAYDMPKRMAATRAGFAVDIWIDDRPHAIGEETR
jgi:hypothetical protein